MSHITSTDDIIMASKKGKDKENDVSNQKGFSDFKVSRSLSLF